MHNFGINCFSKFIAFARVYKVCFIYIVICLDLEVLFKFLKLKKIYENTLIMFLFSANQFEKKNEYIIFSP